MGYERGGEVHERNSREIPTTSTDSVSLELSLRGFYENLRCLEAKRHERLGLGPKGHEQLGLGPKGHEKLGGVS